MLRAATGKMALLVAIFCLVVVQPVSALGINPVISHVKTGESGSASNEFIAIYNNSDQVVDITDWCIVYSSASDATKSTLACLTPSAQNIKLELQPFGYVRFATSVFTSSVTGFIPDAQFSAGLSGTSGHIRLLNSQKIEVDKVGWGSSTSPETTPIPVHPLGSMLVRKLIPSTAYLQDLNNNLNDFLPEVVSTIPASGIVEAEQAVDVCTNLDGLQTTLPDDYYFNVQNQCIQDQCDNLDGLQAGVPTGYESLDGMNCTEQVLNLESSILLITELLPNAASTDAGKEFIEIYNPNEKEVQLNGYKLELGPAYEKSYIFSEGILNAFSYITISDLISGITLPNTTASLRLIAPNNVVVSEAPSYQDPKDDQAWALVNDTWQYTALVTPGSVNQLPAVVSVNVVDEELDPCPVGKYRNPETNRCKTITADEELKPCDIGQVRNPETNRCRSLTSADNLVPCKEGQERNPETNRCRNIITAASALLPCDPGEERNPETNRCRKIAALGASTLADVKDVPASSISHLNWWFLLGIIGVAIAYAVYEWRAELGRFFTKLKSPHE